MRRLAHASIAALALAAAGGAARADATPDDPDTEIAQRYFGEGSARYAERDYAGALERFAAARRVKPLPAFDYNIGRCYPSLTEPPFAGHTFPQ